MKLERVKIVAVKDPKVALRELARQLDKEISALSTLEGAECMREMSPAVRTALATGDTSELSDHVSHLLGHAVPAIHEARRSDGTWGQFWDGLAWNGFASLASYLVATPDDEEIRFGCLAHMAYCIIAIQQGKENPKELHFNIDREEICTPTRGWGLKKLLTPELHERATRLLTSLGCRVI